MEFEVVSEKVEREARRVAVALNADEFRLVGCDKSVSNSVTYALYRGLWGKTTVQWTIMVEEAALQSIRIGLNQSLASDECRVFRLQTDSTCTESVWEPWATMENPYFQSPPVFREHMAHTLYCLGIDIEDEQDLAFLDVSLSAHEKLELRLSMPREFWPQKWLDEEES